MAFYLKCEAYANSKGKR